MYRGFLLFYGLLFIIVGIGGFTVGAVEDALLWDVFNINTLLNTLHVVAGVLAWIVFFLKKNVIRVYYQVAGIFFVLLSLLGFAYDYNSIFNILPSNPANTWFHMIMGLMGLVLGFATNSTYKGTSNERNQRHKKR